MTSPAFMVATSIVEAWVRANVGNAGGDATVVTRARLTGRPRSGNTGPVSLLPLQTLARAESRSEILGLLVDAAVGELGADGAAVLEVSASGPGQVVLSRNLSPEVEAWVARVEGLDGDVGHPLLGTCPGTFARVRAIPMVSGAVPFGALLIFFRTPTDLAGSSIVLAEALATLAAIAIAKVEQHAELSRSYAAIRASKEVLERTQKLRALGEMAAGVFHDLKNILNPLSLHLQLLKRILKRGGQGADEAIAEMEQVLNRGVETVERLREFSRKDPAVPVGIEAVDIDAIACEAIELSRPRILLAGGLSGIRILKELGGPPPIRARSSELLAVLLNLVANAIDAMGEGGTVVVSSGAKDGGAWVRVADEGHGIPKHLHGRIFEPFFTTKGKQGTGLGLAMVDSFVERYGGKLSLETAEGCGATFTLWFPAAS